MSIKFPLEPKIRVLGFTLLSLAYLAWSYTSELGGLGGDNAVYLFSAEHLSPFASGSALAASYFAGSPYPPLFPLSLGLLGANVDLLVSHLAVTSFLLMALLVLYKWQRSLAFSAWPAFALAFLFACLPGTYFQTLEILSETLYLLMTLLGLWMYQQSQTSRRAWLLGAATAIAAATLTRTAGVTLLAALLIHMLLMNRSSRSALAAVIALTPVGAWQVWRDEGGYTSYLATTYGSNPFAAFLDGLPLQATALWHGWIANFATAPPLPIIIAISAFGAVCLAGLAVRLYARNLDAIYVTFYLLLMLIWPFPSESQRFVFAVLPILMAQGLWLLAKLPSTDFAQRRLALAPTVALTALALITFPQLLLHIERFNTKLPVEVSAFKRTAGWYHPDPGAALYHVHFNAQLVEALKTAAAMIPPNECVLSIKPSIVSYYTRRESKSPPAATTPPADFDRQLEQRGCKYLLLVGFSSPTFREAFYPLARVNERITVLEETRLKGESSPTVALLAKIREDHRASK